MSDTVIGSIIGGVVVAVGSVLTWLATRGKTAADSALTRAQLNEQSRQDDITLIINNLKEQVVELRGEVKGLRLENAECLADRDQLRGEFRRLRDRLLMLEKPEGG